ncbi:MAG: pentapeptide repeat-containing protein [Symploca sp. SIO1C4]|uniref:Pentapeptide repeat-containing protein n=1 Tax=Symploca sp. SIO1C4 TaxID=2607765 RepID=A0A6B3NQD1_9CYAN|nr:pentapeptide repeat-containing protein [Symploca sp. SIO1C4]
MANKEQLLILVSRGIYAWNWWRDKNRQVQPDFRGAHLSGANLSKADLSMADLSMADLSKADLNEVNLIWADLSQANLSRADLSRAQINEVNLSSANLSSANLSSANLSGANLSGANLSGANLSGANLSGANFTETNLTEAYLGKTQAENTNFSKSIFTGVCLFKWHINHETNLQGVICDYVYLDDSQQERRPSSGFFAPGEFAIQFQQTLSTVNLVFPDGVNWIAFACSLQVATENEGLALKIQTLDEIEPNVILVRLKVAPGIDTVKIESVLKQRYQLFCELLAEESQTHLESEESTNLITARNRKGDKQLLNDLIALVSKMYGKKLFQSHNHNDKATEHWRKN